MAKNLIKKDAHNSYITYFGYSKTIFDIKMKYQCLYLALTHKYLTNLTVNYHFNHYFKIEVSNLDLIYKFNFSRFFSKNSLFPLLFGYYSKTTYISKIPLKIIQIYKEVNKNAN